MDFDFRDFPKSYQLSQKAMGIGLLVLVVTKFAPIIPPKLQAVVWMVVLPFVIFSFLLAQYVIIRYPYLSLIEPADGDVFDLLFANRKKAIWSLLLWAIILLNAVMIAGVFVGVGKSRELLGMFLILLEVCLLFMALIYSPERHPTVATFIRSTLGIGLMFMPLFLPAILIGSFWNQLLLARQDQKDAFNKDQ